MEDIKIKSKIDLKTYYNISLRSSLRPPVLVFVIVLIGIINIVSFYNTPFDWLSEIVILGIFLFTYGILLPVTIYFSCRKNIRTIPFYNEILQYRINEDVIEFKGDSTSASSSWQYIAKLIERERYILLKTKSRSVHYLPKEGFESKEDIIKLKQIAKEKGIKFSYNFY